MDGFKLNFEAAVFYVIWFPTANIFKYVLAPFEQFLGAKPQIYNP
jgi:hypothetical protein